MSEEAEQLRKAARRLFYEAKKADARDTTDVAEEAFIRGWIYAAFAVEAGILMEMCDSRLGSGLSHKLSRQVRRRQSSHFRQGLRCAKTSVVAKIQNAKAEQILAAQIKRG